MSLLDHEPHQQQPNVGAGDPAQADPSIQPDATIGNDAAQEGASSQSGIIPVADAPQSGTPDKPFWTKGKKIGAAITAAVAIGGGGVGIGVAAGGGHSKAESAPGVSLQNAPGNSKPTPSPTSLTPTSLPSSPESTPTDNPDSASVNLTAIVPNVERNLDVSDATVPEYVADPLTNPVARLNATLADYSYYLSTQNDANAAKALPLLSTDPNVTANLESLRKFWQANKQGSMLWFWTDPTEQTSVTAVDNGDGTTTVTADETIYYKTVTMPYGVWGQPTNLTKAGAAQMPSFEITYTMPEDGSQSEFRNNIVRTKIGNVDSQGAQAVFPTY